MIRIPTKEETEAWSARVAELHASVSTEDRIVAILMDMAVGSQGLYEKIARAKAVEILLLRGLK